MFLVLSEEQLKQGPGKQAVSAPEFLPRTVLGEGNWLGVRKDLPGGCICTVSVFFYLDCVIIGVSLGSSSPIQLKSKDLYSSFGYENNYLCRV